VVVKGTQLWAVKTGRTDHTLVIGIYPDRLPFVASSSVWQVQPDGRLAGFNSNGVRTVLLVPDQLRPGMILYNPNGLLSTRIVRIKP
jgi:hypothetical protein